MNLRFTGGEMTMETYIIQDWTDCHVPITGGAPRDVRYRVYRQGRRHFQDIQSSNGERLHTLELPDGIVLEKSSYEVLLRYALTDVVAA